MRHLVRLLVERLTPVAVAGALLLWVPLARPAPRIDAPAGSALGAAAGGLVFALLARRLRPPPLAELRALAAVAPALAGGAFAEEVLWRATPVGAIEPRLGLPGALAVSVGGFAGAHITDGVGAVSAHLVTGGAFAAVYLGTGRLSAAVAAHLAYNLLVVAAPAASEPAVRPS